MHELNFVRDQKVHQASLDVQWGFVEDIEEDAQKSIEDRLNRMLRLQADRQLRAGRYQRSLERLDYRAGYRARTLLIPKGIYKLRVPRARPVALHFTVFDSDQRLWKRSCVRSFLRATLRGARGRFGASLGHTGQSCPSPHNGHRKKNPFSRGRHYRSGQAGSSSVSLNVKSV